MFGLDLLFDFDKNGKLDAFERAAQLDFLDTLDSNTRARTPVGDNSVYDPDGIGFDFYDLSKEEDY